MTDYVAYLNGKFIPDSECKIHFWDRGIRVGDGVFEAERTFNGKIFRLREHLERLYRSLTFLRIDPGLSLHQMEELTLEVLEKNQSLREAGGDFVLTQFVTRGPGVKITEAGPPSIGIRVRSYEYHSYAHYYKTGTHVVFPRTRSYPPQCVDPKVKHFSRMNFALAELEASDIDPDAYPVLLDLEGNITEHVGSNFFIVTNGTIRTPTDRDILAGISRRTVLELAAQLGIPAIEEDLQPYDAYTADEAFLTTTGYCILPVGRIDNRPIGSRAPGEITNRLLAAWSELVGLDIVDQALRYAAAKNMPA